MLAGNSRPDMDPWREHLLIHNISNPVMVFISGGMTVKGFPDKLRSFKFESWLTSEGKGSVI